MNKKAIITIFIILSILAVTAVVFFNKKDVNKIKLSNQYYGEGEFIETNSAELKEKNDENYILFVYNNYCTFKVPCDEVFLSYAKESKIKILSISFAEFKETDFYKVVYYAPSVLIIKNNTIVSYLDAEIDEDVNKYQDVHEFAKWLNTYIETEK